MKVSELSRRSGVSIPTIKYYIREGLLPPGERTSTNQATYGQRHLDRLDLVRSLREVGGLGVATIKEALDAIEAGATQEGRTPALGIALRALSTAPAAPEGTEDDATSRQASARADELLEQLAWQLPPDPIVTADLVAALTAVERYWPGGVALEKLLAYGQVAEQLAELEIPETWDPQRQRGDALRYAVLGTVLFEAVVLSLRRLAHIDRSRRLAAQSASAPMTSRAASWTEPDIEG